MEPSDTGTPREIPTFPPTVSRRRRPLRSRTSDLFFSILSVCADYYQNIETSDKGSTDIESAREPDAPLAHTDIIPNDSLCQGEMVVGETRVVLGMQEGSSYNKHVESAECDHCKSGGREELQHMAEKRTCNALDNRSQDNSDTDSPTLRIGDQQSIPKLHVEKLNEQTKMGIEMSKDGACDAHGTSLDMEKIVGVSDPSRENTEKSPMVCKSSLEDVEDETQHVELDKSVSVSDLMDSLPYLTMGKDVEEGEVSDEFMDFKPEDDTSSVDNTRSGVHFTEDFIGIESNPGLENDANSSPLCTDTVACVGNDTEAVVSNTKRNLVDYSEIAGRGKTIQAVRVDRRLETRERAKEGNATKESDRTLLQGFCKNSATENQDLLSLDKDTGSQNDKKRRGSPPEEKRTNKKVKKSDSLTVCPENPTMLGEDSGDASQELVDASANKDDANEKKKKRVLTEERKAKKKHKDRIKRAEKNRKLGVKRLKLQPVIKEKKVSYCRHYMNGRCHKGEECIFSHDTIPLTKSKPCRHFARHACMKGDDCPFDHQLSKYPCNNYVSKGFCSRRSDCLFSHEAQPGETSLSASKSSSVADISGSKKHNNINGPCEKVATKSCWTPNSATKNTQPNTKSCSTPISVAKNTQPNPVETTRKVPVRPPKGITFLSQGTKLSLDKVENDETRGRETALSAPRPIRDSSEITKTPPVVPRGINFLSFGKKPGSDNPNCSFSLKIGNGIGKSPLSNPAGNGGEGVKIGDKKRVDSDPVANWPSPSTLNLNLSRSPLPRALESTLSFASRFESGVKTSKPVDQPGNSIQK